MPVKKNKNPIFRYFLRTGEYLQLAPHAKNVSPDMQQIF